MRIQAFWVIFFLRIQTYRHEETYIIEVIEEPRLSSAEAVLTRKVTSSIFRISPYLVFSCLRWHEHKLYQNINEHKT